MPETVDRAMMGLALELEGRLKRSAREKLNKDPTGDLVRSIQAQRERGGIFVGTDREYAQIQDKGGTVRAKGRYLAIPIEQPKSLRGKWPRDYAEGELSPRFPKSGKDPVLIHISGRLEFALKPSVVIPSTGWFSEIIDEMGEWAGQVLLEEIGPELKLLNRP